LERNQRRKTMSFWMIGTLSWIASSSSWNTKLLVIDEMSNKYWIFCLEPKITKITKIPIEINVWLKWKILLDPRKWHIFWRFGPYWVQKYPFRRDRWKIRRWWVILPRRGTSRIY
jgi:hypothetical protein